MPLETKIPRREESVNTQPPVFTYLSVYTDSTPFYSLARSDLRASYCPSTYSFPSYQPSALLYAQRQNTIRASQMEAYAVAEYTVDRYTQELLNMASTRYHLNMVQTQSPNTPNQSRKRQNDSSPESSCKRRNCTSTQRQEALNKLENELKQDSTYAAIAQAGNTIEKIKLLKPVIDKCRGVGIKHKDIHATLKQYCPDDFKNLSAKTLSNYITQNLHYEDKRNIEVTGKNETQQKALDNFKEKLEHDDTRAAIAQEKDMIKKIRLLKEVIHECCHARAKHKDIFAILKQYYPDNFKNLNIQTFSNYITQHLYHEDRRNIEVIEKNEMQQKALNNLKKKLEQDDTRAAIIQEKSMLKKIKLLKWVIKKCFDVFVPYKDLLVVLKQYYPDDFKNLSVSVLSSYITQNFHYEDKRNIEVTGQNETQQKALNNLKKKLEQKNTRVTLSQAQKMLKKIKLFRDAIIECRNAYVPHKDTLAVLKQYYPNDFKNLNAQTLSAYTSQHLYDNDRGNEEVTGENKAQQAALDNLKKKLEQDDTRAAITQEKGMLKKIKLLKEVINECYAVHVSHKDVFTILKKYYPDDFKNLSTQTLSNYINQHLL